MSHVFDHVAGKTVLAGNFRGRESAIDYIRQHKDNARTRAGMPGLHFHDLRHTFASLFMMNGGDLYVLKGILGHKSITMTQRFAHFSPAYTKAVVERMEQIRAKTTSTEQPARTPLKTHFPTARRHSVVTMPTPAVTQ